jgi:hypothetical protein
VKWYGGITPRTSMHTVWAPALERLRRRGVAAVGDEAVDGRRAGAGDRRGEREGSARHSALRSGRRASGPRRSIA